MSRTEKILVAFFAALGLGGLVVAWWNPAAWCVVAIAICGAAVTID